MVEMGLQSVVAAIQDAFGKGDRAKVDQLLWPALDQFPDYPPLWFFAANQHFEQGRSALAIQDFRRAIELENNPIFWANLGAALRRINRTDEARKCLQIALEMSPNDGSALTNMCATYVNEGMPEEGIRWGEKALLCNDKQAGRATWNLALLYLEAGDFAKGFAHYHNGINHERQLRMFTSQARRAEEPKVLEPSDERAGKRLIVYGEQGLGDEIMFSTVLRDALAEFAEITFECHPRLERMHRRAFADMVDAGRLILHPTRKEAILEWPRALEVMPDYKAPIGDLCHLYRHSREDFLQPGSDHGKGFGLNIAPVEETSWYRKRLEALAGGRKIIGFAMRGGVIQTNRLYRTIKEKDLDPLFKRDDLMLVSLDYEDITTQMAWHLENYGRDRYWWFPAITHGWDYGDHTAALVEACDATLTVCQSVAHLSASLGKPTFVLTPSRPAWRYGLTGEDWHWYAAPSVRLLRQSESPRGTFDWQPAVARAMECIDELDTD